MPYKNEKDRIKNYQEHYFKKFGHYPKPLVRKTKEEKAETKKAWAKANADKEKEYARKSRLKHKKQRAIDNKNWVKSNYEYHLEYHKNYNKKWYSNKDNKKKQDKRGEEWAKNNPKRMAEIQKKFRDNNQDKVKAYLKEYEKTIKAKFRATKFNAKRRGYKFNLSSREYTEIVLNPCVYCGENKQRIGIDRVDNKIGYTLKNSVPCCFTCNMMKRIMTVEEFLKHIEKIYKHNL